MAGSGAKWKSVLMDVLFPEGNACHLCGRFADQTGILCSGCVNELNALRYKQRQMVSAEMHAPLAICVAAYPHRGKARELVHLLKFQSDSSAAQWLAEGMASALACSPLAPERADVLIPVPLHASRLEQRGYNQALLLAQGVSRHTGIQVLENVLLRIQPTDTQLHRDRTQRLQAMRHAFAVSDARSVRGLHVLLADDVLTTGATAVSCARTLLEAGAASVSLLTACRA